MSTHVKAIKFDVTSVGTAIEKSLLRALADVARADSKQPQLTVSKKMVLRTVLPRLVLLQSDPPVMSPLNSNTHLLACIPHALARSFHKHKRVCSVLHMRVCQSLGQNSAKILNVTIRTHVLQDSRQQKTGCQPRRELEHVSFLQKTFLSSTPAILHLHIAPRILKTASRLSLSWTRALLAKASQLWGPHARGNDVSQAASCRGHTVSPTVQVMSFVVCDHRCITIVVQDVQKRCECPARRAS